VAISEYTVRYVLHVYFFTFFPGVECFETQNIPIVTALDRSVRIETPISLTLSFIITSSAWEYSHVIHQTCIQHTQDTHHCFNSLNHLPKTVRRVTCLFL